MNPIKIETIEKLRRRFPSALIDVYDPAKVTDENRPGVKDKHIFDFEEGIRMVISIDLFNKVPCLHLSVSMCKEQWEKYKENNNMAIIPEIMKGKFDEIADRHYELELVAVSDHGVFHFKEQFQNNN